MVAAVFDRVLVTVASAPGIGDFALSTAHSTGRTFVAAGAVNGQKVKYGARESSNKWEIGVGTYVAATNTITRDTVICSSAANAKENFGAATQVFSDVTRDNFVMNFVEEGAHVAALADGANAQALRVYNTLTDALNYERLAMGWASNVAYLDVQNAGSGLARSFEIRLSGTQRLAITSAGNVGIGTTSSAHPLHVLNSVSTVARFQRDGGSVATRGYLDVTISDFDGGGGDVILDSAATGDIALRSNAGGGGTVRVKNGGDTVITGGNVGIGTTAPSTTLHVNGPARVGQYTVATLPSASTAGFGAIVFVSDANAVTPRSIVAGGGTNKVMVWSDGTNWLIAA